MTDPQIEQQAPEPTDGRESGALFGALTTRDPSPEAAYNAVKEVESMAGANVVAQMTARIDTVETRLNARMDALDAKIDRVATRLNARIDALDAKIDRVAAELNTKFDAMNRQLKWMWGLQVATLVAILATMGGMLTTLLVRP